MLFFISQNVHYEHYGHAILILSLHFSNNEKNGTILTYRKPTFIHDKIISQFTGNKLVRGSNILQVNFVFLLQPYKKGWFAAINFPTRKLSRTSQNFLAWE